MATLKKYLLKLWGKVGQPMRPTSHLHDTGIFRTAIYGPVLLGIGFATIGYLNSTLEPNWTLEGFNTFISSFRLPIAISGLAIPLGALVASHHRSIQSASQIIEQNQQNIFSNYLEHRRYFLAFVEEHKPFEKLTVSAPHLYQRLFPKSAEGSLNPANKSLDELLEIIKKTASLCKTAIKNELSEKKFKIIDDVLDFHLNESTKKLSQFIQLPKFKSNKTSEDPLDLISQTLRQNLDGIKGLIDCANFHKTYRQEDDLSELKSNTEFCLERIYANLKYYNLWKMLKAELSGQNASNPNQPIEGRLENVKLNMDANKMEAEHLEIIFNNHLEEEEKQKLLKHGPVGWRILLTAPNT